MQGKPPYTYILKYIYLKSAQKAATNGTQPLLRFRSVSFPCSAFIRPKNGLNLCALIEVRGLTVIIEPITLFNEQFIGQFFERFVDCRNGHTALLCYDFTRRIALAVLV
jgi:hypothetical protein